MDLVDEMLILKQTHLNLEDLRTDVEAFQTSIMATPELHHSKALEKIETAFAKIRKTIKKSKVKPDHPTRQEINSFSTLLTRLSSQIETSTASAAPSTTPIIIRSKDSDETCDLPKIGIPEFHGDIMEWASFWAQFEAAIDSHERLSDVRKLAYLRKAIKDPDTKELLQSGAETGGLYKEVVAVLKKRFDRTSEIHRNHCLKLTQFGNVKGTRTDLRKFVDAANTIKHSGYYNLDSFLTSVFYSNMTVKIQTLWEQHSRKTKGVPPVREFLDFIGEHAETLAGPSTTPAKPSEGKGRTENMRRNKSHSSTSSTRLPSTHRLHPLDINGNALCASWRSIHFMPAASGSP